MGRRAQLDEIDPVQLLIALIAVIVIAFFLFMLIGWVSNWIRSNISGFSANPPAVRF